VLAGLGLACASLGLGDAAWFDFAAPSEREHYCAWYGDARDGVLYFGQAPFWSAMRANGDDPTADLLTSGPVPIGRFDLATERPLPALEVGREGDRSGVWDVLAHPNGRVYFTTFYEPAGYVATDGSPPVRFEGLGAGLNELVLGPGDSILATRYASESGEGGSIVRFDPAGRLLAEHPLPKPAGYRVAPKTPAFDPIRDETWVTTDLLPENPIAPAGHDTFVLDARGGLVARIVDPEIQFVAFAPDGHGYVAEVSGRSLFLRVIPPGAGPDSGTRRALDDAFHPALDFVQDIHVADDGRVVVTRWSGFVHVLTSDGEIGRVRLPALEERRPSRIAGEQPAGAAGAGLYYSGVAEGDRICATHCAGVSVVCRDAP
jgi:hypothetical protein